MIPNRNVVVTKRAPQAIGPYSQAIRTRDFLFLSGQIPLDPATGQLDPSQDIKAQTERVLLNLQGILEAEQLSLERVVKTTVFLTNLADFAAMNEVYARFFPSAAPARSTVQVAALPKGARIEIEAVAVCS
jgi:2-iminobutanoate/2-iminopropanoate deaminase